MGVPFAAYNLATRELIDLLISAIVSVVFAYLIRLGVGVGVRLYIRRQLDKLLAPLKSG